MCISEKFNILEGITKMMFSCRNRTIGERWHCITSNKILSLYSKYVKVPSTLIFAKPSEIFLY